MGNNFWGPGNGPLQYLIVLIGYGALFIVMRAIHPRIDDDFRRRYVALGIGWFIGTFIGNYVLYRMGAMSFLPWLNNFCHTFIWIGLCLGFMYGGVYRRSGLEQFALFAIFSFIVKWGEFTVLGTWEHDHFFFIQGHVAYLIGWSLADGLYPMISVFGLRLLGQFVVGMQPTPAYETERTYG